MRGSLCSADLQVGIFRECPICFEFCVLTFICGSVVLRYHAGTNLVLLDPDVRKAFRSERAVNQALRLVIELRRVGSYNRRDYSSNGA